MSKKNKKKQSQKPQETKRPGVIAHYSHCGMITETLETEDNVFCNGCHHWIKTDSLERLNADGTTYAKQ